MQPKQVALELCVRHVNANLTLRPDGDRPLPLSLFRVLARSARSREMLERIEMIKCRYICSALAISAPPADLGSARSRRIVPQYITGRDSPLYYILSETKIAHEFDHNSSRFR